MSVSRLCSLPIFFASMLFAGGVAAEPQFAGQNFFVTVGGDLETLAVEDMDFDGVPDLITADREDHEVREEDGLG